MARSNSSTLKFTLLNWLLSFADCILRIISLSSRKCILFRFIIIFSFFSSWIILMITDYLIIIFRFKLTTVLILILIGLSKFRGSLQHYSAIFFVIFISCKIADSRDKLIELSICIHLIHPGCTNNFFTALK